MIRLVSYYNASLHNNGDLIFKKKKFQQINALNGVSKRYFIIGSVIRGVLKLRYLVLATTAGGGYYVNKKYEEIKEHFPNLGKFKYYLPEEKAVDSFVNTLRSKVYDVTEINKDFASKISGEIQYTYRNFGDWLKEKSGEFVTNVNKKDLDEMETIMEIDKLKHQITTIDLEESSIETDALMKTKEELQEIQVVHEKEKRQLEDEIQELKRQLLLNRHRKTGVKSKIKKSLIEMYSEVLDELEQYDHHLDVQDKLPRVIVVGEQSAGKTSVLEMVAGARLFPRGSGSMMTRCPVKVTLAEGPYKLARFENDPTETEYDLDSEKGCSQLRADLETKMSQLAPEGCVSKQAIALSVRGPNLHRMVLVDLPGVISTVTTGMSGDVKDSVSQLATQYMSNPNAIILCIQDASRDAESSSIVDMVSTMDPTGKRTIFVLTKLDQAIEQLSDPNRIKDILSGRVYKMKALGYFGVVAGKGGSSDDISSIKKYEIDFFKHSNLFKDGKLKGSQMTTGNMSKAVSDLFWKMVKESVELQSDRFRALKSNIENEWKHKYSNVRQLDRNELFDKAKIEILDNLVSLSVISPTIWEDKLTAALWSKIKQNIFENIYFPALEDYNSFGEYKTTLENCISAWALNELTQQTISVGWESMKATLEQIGSTNVNGKTKSSTDKSDSSRQSDSALFDNLRRQVEKVAFQRHKWDSKADSSLKIIQSEALNDVPIRTKTEWDEAVKFLSDSLDDYLLMIKQTKSALKGPGALESWTKWTSRTPIQRKRVAVFDEADQILNNEPFHKMNLSADEVTAVKRNLQMRKIDVDAVFIRETWKISYKEFVLERAKQYAKDCQKGFYHYRYGFAESSNFDCKDVQLFYRLHRMLLTSSAALRNQIMNNEVQRMDRIVKEILEEIGNNPNQLKQLIAGDRVSLAENIKKVSTIQEKLDNFISSLNKDKC